MHEPTDTPTATADKKDTKKMLPASPPLQSVSELLRVVYAGKQKRVTVKKADINSMRSAPKLEQADREELLCLAASDRMLERTRDLMLMCMDWSDAQYLADHVLDFARQVLRNHPAFLVEPLDHAFESSPEAPREDRAVRVLLDRSFAALKWPAETAQLKKNEAMQCQMNALSCLLIWFRQKRGISLEQILHHLQDVWMSVTPHKKGSIQKLRTLLTTRDSAAVLAACTVLGDQFTALKQQTASARRNEELALEKANVLEEKLSTTQEQLETARATIAARDREMAETVRSHSDTLAHMRDDYEELRGRVLRRLKEELSLLDEGLHALQREPPKVHVMIDHAERAIDGLKREMDRLRGGEQ